MLNILHEMGDSLSTVVEFCLNLSTSILIRISCIHNLQSLCHQRLVLLDHKIHFLCVAQTSIPLLCWCLVGKSLHHLSGFVWQRHEISQILNHWSSEILLSGGRQLFKLAVVENVEHFMLFRIFSLNKVEFNESYMF